MMVNISELPHGHGFSYKKGVSDGLFGESKYEDETSKLRHTSSYKKGYELGETLKSEVASKVKPNNINKT